MKRILIRSPVLLARKITKIANEKGLSRNQLINAILESWVNSEREIEALGQTKEALKAEIKAELMKDFLGLISLKKRCP